MDNPGVHPEPVVFMVAGEASGDQRGAELAQALRGLRPQVRISGVGGAGMRSAGVQLLFESTQWGAIGLAASLRRVPRLLGKLNAICQRLQAHPPDLLILIDFGAFNLRLARFARDQEIPTLYYFPPRSWDRNCRSAKIKELVDAIATPFPWFRQALAGGRARVEWVGHPFLDSVRPRLTKDQAYRKFGLDSSQSVVALIPGSRREEIRYNLPALLGAAQRLKGQWPGVQFLLPVAVSLDPDELKSYAKSAGLSPTWLQGMEYDALQLARVALVSSGTATLELACLGIPMVVVYRGSIATWLQFELFQALGKVRMIALPNIIADKKIIPELTQWAANSAAISKLAASLMAEGQERQQMIRELAEVRGSLGSPGAANRTARLALQLIDSRAVGAAHQADGLR